MTSHKFFLDQFVHLLENKFGVGWASHKTDYKEWDFPTVKKEITCHHDDIYKIILIYSEEKKELYQQVCDYLNTYNEEHPDKIQLDFAPATYKIIKPEFQEKAKEIEEQNVSRMNQVNRLISDAENFGFKLEIKENFGKIEIPKHFYVTYGGGEYHHKYHRIRIFMNNKSSIYKDIAEILIQEGKRLTRANYGPRVGFRSEETGMFEWKEYVMY
jgi:hypothetical protein